VLVHESDKVASGHHPTGRPIALTDLPSNGIRRWTPMRKAELVACVRAGLITRVEACERYLLSEEELQSWDSYLDRHGVAGLRTTRLQEYRNRTELGV
jgi:hypothetical protein